MAFQWLQFFYVYIYIDSFVYVHIYIYKDSLKSYITTEAYEIHGSWSKPSAPGSLWPSGIELAKTVGGTCHSRRLTAFSVVGMTALGPTACSRKMQFQLGFSCGHHAPNFMFLEIHVKVWFCFGLFSLIRSYLGLNIIVISFHQSMQAWQEINLFQCQIRFLANLDMYQCFYIWYPGREWIEPLNLVVCHFHQ